MTRHVVLRFAVVLAAIAVTGPSLAYGPPVHVREADRYAALHPELGTPELRPYLQLGAVFPDIGQASVTFPVGTHAKGLADALLAAAEVEGTPWKVAFATGYRLHLASDISSHVYVVPWLTAHGNLGTLNLFGAPDVKPAGDNELLVESWGDLRNGHTGAFVDMAWAFVFEDTAALEEVVDFYAEVMTAYAGGGADAEALKAELMVFWEDLKAKVGSMEPELAMAIVDGLLESGCGGFLDILDSGLLGSVLAGFPQGDELGEPHPGEVRRLLEHPACAAPDDFWGLYGAHFADLGPTILDTDAWFTGFPTYRGQVIAAGVLQGLAADAPELWAHRPDVLLYDAGFVGPDGKALTAIDAAAPPGEVTAWTEVFLARGEAVEVELRVIVDRPGIGRGPTPAEDVVATATAIVSPGPERTVLSATFDPGPRVAEAEGFALEWRRVGDALPWLTSDVARYWTASSAAAFRAPYVSGFDAYPPRLAVTHAAPPVAWGSVRGHLVLPGLELGVAGAVRVGDDAAWVDTTPWGGFLLEPLAPGEHVLEATGARFVAGPVPVVVEAAAVTVANLVVTPVPLARTAVTWTDVTDAVRLDVDVSHFHPVPAVVEVRATLEDGQTEVLPWTEAAPGAVDLPLPALLPDGAAVLAFVRAGEGPEATSPVWRVDASPPPAPTLAVEAVACDVEATATVEGADPHSPIDAWQLRVAGDPDWTDGPTALLLLPDGPVVLEARVRNAAGSWSQPATVLLCDTLPPVDPGPEPPAEPPPEPPPPAADPPAPATGGCAGGGATPLYWLIATTALLGWRRRMTDRHASSTGSS